jgi:hypothetical protein
LLAARELQPAQRALNFQFRCLPHHWVLIVCGQLSTKEGDQLLSRFIRHTSLCPANGLKAAKSGLIIAFDALPDIQESK